MRPLRQQQHASDHADRKDKRRQGTAQRESSVIQWRVETVADRRAKGRVRIKAPQNKRTRVAKSASVVPAVVEATMTDQ